MSIEKEIPRDISRYEAKAIGGFTTRQLVCGIPAIGLAVGAYFLTRNYLGEDGAFCVAFFVAMPLLLLGFAKPYGMHLEKFLSIVFISLVLAPKHRKYITHNTFSDLIDTDKCVRKTLSKRTNNNKKKKKDAYTGEYQQYL